MCFTQGIGGSALFLLLSAAGLSNSVIFALQVPTAVLYAVAYFFILKKIPHTDMPAAAPARRASTESASLTQREAPRARYVRVARLVTYYAFHLSMVYFLEYVASGTHCTPDVML